MLQFFLELITEPDRKQCPAKKIFWDLFEIWSQDHLMKTKYTTPHSDGVAFTPLW